MWTADFIQKRKLILIGSLISLGIVKHTIWLGPCGTQSPSDTGFNAVFQTDISAGYVRALHAHTEKHEASEAGAPNHSTEDHDSSDEEHHSSRVSFVVGILLTGCMVTGTLVIWFMNYDTATTRFATAQMVSKTVSIFTAVHVNKAANDFFFKQVLRGQKIGALEKGMFGAIMFVVTFILLNVLCWRFRKGGPGLTMGKKLLLCRPCRHRWGHGRALATKHSYSRLNLYAVQSFIAHIHAFSSAILFMGFLESHYLKERLRIDCVVPFGPLCNLVEKPQHVLYSFVVLLTAFLIWRVARQISGCWRRSGCCGVNRANPTTTTINNSDDDNDNEETDNAWADRALEGENEAFSISLSFLFCYIAQYHITGHMPSFPKEHTEAHEFDLPPILIMVSVAALVLLLSLAVVAYAGKEKALVFALCASWCSLIAGQWLFQRKILPLEFDEIEWSTADKLDIEPIAVAVMFTMLFVLWVGCAELYEMLLSAITPRRGVRETAFQTQRKQAARESVFYTRMIEVPHKFDMPESKLLFLESFGTLVGLAWEEAFHGAEDSIIQGLGWTSDHPVTSACCIAVLSMALVLILWRRFIIPKAILNLKEQQNCIEEEEIMFLAGGLKKDDEVVLRRTILLSNDKELPETTRGRVVGPPAHYHDSMVRCTFELTSNAGTSEEDFQIESDISILEEDLEKVEFPNFLGPFDIDLTWFHHGNFSFIEDDLDKGAEWEMQNIPKKVRLFLQRTKRVRSVFSPLAEVTTTMKQMGQINPSAKFFAWSYPMHQQDQDEDEDEQMVDVTSSPEIAFLTVGGFVYFDNKKKVLQVAGLVRRPHGALKFGNPVKWKEHGAQMRQSAGFQKITLKALSDQGAETFCWINPGERLMNGPTIEHGAFAYRFKDAANIYFELQPA